MNNKYWRSSECKATQVMLATDSDFDDYQPGDTEPCLCGNLKCYATVEVGAPAELALAQQPAAEPRGSSPKRPDDSDT